MRTLLIILSFLTCAYAAEPARDIKPVLIGLDAEFGYAGSTSAEAISAGIQIAIEEINRAGGVLGGRPLALLEKANHSVPARSIDNIKQFAAMPDLVAIFCGRFSPTVLEALPTLTSLQIPLLDPWAAADGIIDNGTAPNYAFRLSLRDSWAMPAMLRYAQSKGATRVGLLMLNTSWGRGNLKAAEQFVAGTRSLAIAGVHWFNWDDRSFLDKYRALLKAGAQAMVLTANPNEASILIKEVAGLAPEERLPIISHWGVSGGQLPELAGAALHQVDFSVVQTYSFIGATRPKADSVAKAAMRKFNVNSVRALPSPTGIAHAYDLTHILALAINQAGSTDRAAIRHALEHIKSYDGLIKHFKPPFSPKQHEALSQKLVFIAKYAQEDNAIVRVWPALGTPKKKFKRARVSK
jgi:branched-chain amino acid transport system substrate-binding protein